MTPELRDFRLHPAARAAWRRAADELLINAIFGDEGRGAADVSGLPHRVEVASRPEMTGMQLRAETIAA